MITDSKRREKHNEKTGISQKSGRRYSRRSGGHRGQRTLRARTIENTRLAHTENESGLRVVAGERLPERGYRPIDGGPESFEQRVPIDALTAGRRVPQWIVRRVCQQLVHVVAGPQSEMLQREFQRHGPGSAKSRANHR